jgi:hypothetical protein
MATETFNTPGPERPLFWKQMADTLAARGFVVRWKPNMDRWPVHAIAGDALVGELRRVGVFNGHQGNDFELTLAEG